MNPERWQAIRTLFDEAVRCAPPDREVFLRERCSGDPDLQSSVERPACRR